MRKKIPFLTSLCGLVLLFSCENDTSTEAIQYSKVKTEDLQKEYIKQYKWTPQTIVDTVQSYVDTAQSLYTVETDLDTNSLKNQLEQRSNVIKNMAKSVNNIPVSDFVGGKEFKKAGYETLLFYSVNISGYYSKALVLKNRFLEQPDQLQNSLYGVYMNASKEDEKIHVADYVSNRDQFLKSN